MDGQCAPGEGGNSRRTGDGDCSGFAAAAAGTDAIATATGGIDGTASDGDTAVIGNLGSISTANACPVVLSIGVNVPACDGDGRELFTATANTRARIKCRSRYSATRNDNWPYYGIKNAIAATTNARTAAPLTRCGVCRSSNLT